MNDRHALAAGLFVILSIAATLFILVQVSDTAALFAEQQQWQASFPPGNDVQGLREESPVRLFGVEVGNVKDIAIQPAADGDHRVLVSFTMPKKYQLREGAEITVQSGLTGGALLYIAAMGDGKPLDPSVPVESAAASFAQVLAKLNDAMPEAQGALTAVRGAGEKIQLAIDDGRGLIQKVSDKVDPVVSRYDSVMQTAREMLDHAREVLGDTKVDIRTAIANVRDVTATARDRLPVTIDNVDNALGKASEFMTKARASLDKVDPVMDNAKVITGNLRSVVTEGRPKIERTFTNIQQASEDFKGGISEIRRAPWRLLNKPDQRDEHNLLVYAAARDLAAGAADLEATAATLEALMSDPNADPQRIAEIRDELIRKYRDFSEAQDEIWSQYRP